MPSFLWFIQLLLSTSSVLAPFVAMPGATNSVLAPSSDAVCYYIAAMPLLLVASCY